MSVRQFRERLMGGPAFSLFDTADLLCREPWNV